MLDFVCLFVDSFNALFEDHRGDLFSDEILSVSIPDHLTL